MQWEKCNCRMTIHMRMTDHKCKKIMWASLFLVLVVYYATLLYPDINVTYFHSLTFLDCLFDGNLSNFYSITLEKTIEGWGAVYYIPIYLIFAVWNFPVWLLCKLGVISVLGCVALLWTKLMVFISVIGCAYVLHKLLEFLDNTNKTVPMFLFMSSFFVVLPAFAMGQYDSLPLVVTLMGIYYYIHEDEFSLKTLFLFSLAISLKLFAIFPFFFLVLLKEKRILHIVKDMCLGMLITFLSMLIFLKDPGYETAVSSFNGSMLSRLMVHCIPGGHGQISLFFTCAMAMYIWAYTVSPHDEEELLRYVAWFGAFFFFIFVLFVNTHPQWNILLAPFLILLISKQTRNLRINYILEMILELSCVIVQLVAYDLVYLQDWSFSYLALKYLPVISDIYSIDNFKLVLNHFGIADLLPAFHGIFAASGVALLILNVPWQKSTIEHSDDDSFINGLCIFRICCLIGFFMCGFFVTYVI